MNKKRKQALVRYFLAIFLLVNLIGFFYFEFFLLLKYVMFFLSVLAIYLLVSKKSDFLLILAVYLMFFNLFNLTYVNWGEKPLPLWIIMLISVLLGSFLFYLGLKNRETETKIITMKNLNYFYTGLLALLTLEVFLAINYWQIDPKNKSIIMLVVFYLIWGVVCQRVEDVLTLKKVFIYLLISFIIIAATILTVDQWQIY